MYVSIGTINPRRNIQDVFLLRADSEEMALQKIIELIETTDVDMRAVDVFTYDAECQIRKEITVYTKDKKDKLHLLVRAKGFPSLVVMPDNPNKEDFSPLDIEFYNRYNKSLGGHLDRIAKGECVMCR